MEIHLDKTPFPLLQSLFGNDEILAIPMVLSTSNHSKVSSRTVLLKQFKDNNFIFCTNMNSQKAQDIFINPNVSLLFFSFDKIQIIVQGLATKISDNIADHLFANRTREKQIVSHSSIQSAILPKYSDFTEQIDKMTSHFKTYDKIPRPKDWSGFSVKPEVVEILFYKDDRAHIRAKYSINELWDFVLLYP